MYVCCGPARVSVALHSAHLTLWAAPSCRVPQMYREHATTARGAAAIDTLVSAVFKEFTSFEDVRLVIRNIVRVQLWVFLRTNRHRRRPPPRSHLPACCTCMHHMHPLTARSRVCVCVSNGCDTLIYLPRCCDPG